MMKLNLPELRRILCLGAHADDIEIGCGGTLMRILAQNRAVSVYWIVLGATPPRTAEARHSADAFLRDARDQQVIIKGFRDAFFPYCGADIKSYFNELSRQFEPDLIFTHHLADRHQDHRLVSELTWNTFRNHLICEYEIPKYEGDLGAPNLFVPLSKTICQRKIETIIKAFASQKKRAWFSADTFWALLRLRGLESKSASTFAEALHCRKMVI